MNAAEIFDAARQAHVSIALDGDHLVLVGDDEPPPELLLAVKKNKSEIIAILTKSGRRAIDWHDFFHERAAIREFHGQYTRAEAEAQALEDCVIEWLRRNPSGPNSRGCAACGGRGDHEVLVPYGLGRHIALHARCWQGWYEARKAAAIVALKSMGIPPA